MRSLARHLLRTLSVILIMMPIGVLSHPAQASGSRPLFQLPFPCGESWRLSTYYGHDDYDIDMIADRGRTSGRIILASYGGTVAFAGWGAASGWHVQLDHPGGWSTLYLHMIEPPSVIADQTVSIGQQLGRVGSTGDSSGPHLHYEQIHNGVKVESRFNGEPSGITSDGGPYTGPIYESGSPSRPVHRVSRNCVGRDFGGDHRADVLGRDSATGNLYLYQGNGVGGFLFGSPAGGDWSEFDTVVSAWDVDRDGDNDIIARHRTTKDLHLFRGNGTGGFQSRTGKVISRDWSRYDMIFAARDFSGDGQPDLVAKNSSTGDLHLYKGNGAGGFESGRGRVIGKDWYRFDIILSPGDFDGDGDTDVLARHRTTKDLHLFRGDGNRGFQLGTGGVISQNWSVFDSVFSVGDFTGDGLSDLLARHATTKDLHLYRGNGTGGFLPDSGNVIGDNWAAYDQLL